jgi:O-antigen/teichoic acid export membrane protein
MYFGRFFQMGVALFVSVWVARYLGPENYGLISYSQSFVALFAGISTLGLDSIVIRELTKNNEKRDELLGTAFALKLIGAIICLIIIFVMLLFSNNNISASIQIFIIASSVVFQSFNVIDFYFQSEVKSKYSVIASVISLSITSIIKIILIILKARLIYFIIAISIDSIVLSSSLIYFYKKEKLSIKKWKINKQISTLLLKESWPLMLSYMSYMIYARIDQVMIKNMIDNKSVGYYSVAFNIYQIPVFIPVVLSQSVYPYLINTYKNSIEKFNKIYETITTYLTLSSYILVFFFFIFSNLIIRKLFGQTYLESSNILFYLSIGLIPMFNAGLRSNFMTISNNQKIILYTSVISAILNILLNYLLIPLIGVKGSVIATIITQIISLIILNIFFENTRKLFYIQINALLQITTIKLFFKTFKFKTIK